LRRGRRRCRAWNMGRSLACHWWSQRRGASGTRCLWRCDSQSDAWPSAAPPAVPALLHGMPAFLRWRLVVSPCADAPDNTRAAPGQTAMLPGTRARPPPRSAAADVHSTYCFIQLRGSLPTGAIALAATTSAMCKFVEGSGHTSNMPMMIHGFERYSLRRRAIGSIRDAVRAGRKVPNSATAVNSSATEASVHGSVLFTPYS
jgi:hypothetical protein